MMKYLIIFILTSTFLFSEQDFLVELGNPYISDPNISNINRGFYHNRYYIKLFENNYLNILVDTYSGNLLIERIDKIDFYNVSFYYNSGSSFSGQFGNKWQFKYAPRLATNNRNNNIIYISGDDKSSLFKFVSENNSFENNEYLKLVKNGNYFEIFNPYDKLFNYQNVKYIDFDGNYQFEEIVISGKDTIRVNFLNFRYDKILFDDYNIILNNINGLLASLYKDVFQVASYIYDKNNNLKTVNYANGDFIFFEYDNCNLIRKIKFDANHEIRVEYNDSLQVNRISFIDSEDTSSISIDYFDNYTEFSNIYGYKYIAEYDLEKFVRLTEPSGYFIENKYLSNNHIERYDQNRNKIDVRLDSNRVEIIDELNNRTTTEIGNYGIVQLKSKKNNLRNYHYDNNLLYEIDDYDDKSYLFIHDNKRLSQFIDKDLVATEFYYDKLGNINNINILGLGNIEFEFDEHGNVNKIIENDTLSILIENLKLTNNSIKVKLDKDLYKEFKFQNGKVTNTKIDNLNYSFKYDKFNNIEEILSNNYKLYNLLKVKNEFVMNYFDIVHNIEIDSLLRIKKYFYNQQSIFHNIYNPVGNLKSQLLNNTIIEEMNYDALKRIVYYKDISGNIFNYKYDASSNPIEYTINNIITTKYEYDNNNNLKNITFPNQSNLQIFRNETGNILSIKDQKGSITKYRYDNINRFVSKSIEDNTLLEKKHILLSSNIQEIDSLGINLKYRYDVFNRIIQNIYNDLLIVDFKYDTIGHLKSYIYNDLFSFNLNSVGNSYVINKSGDIYKFDYFNGKLNNFENKGQINNFLFNQNSQLVEYSNNFRTSKFRYNNQNKLLNSLNNELLEINLIYNNNHIAEVNGPLNSRLKFEYQDFSLFNTISFALSDRIRISRNNSAFISNVNYQDNSVLEYSYDENANIVKFNNNNNIFDFSYNMNNNLIAIQNPDFSVESIEYHPNQTVKKISNRFTELNYDYNEFNLMSRIQSRDLDLRIEYDSLLRLSQVNYGNDSINYSYIQNQIEIDINDVMSVSLNIKNDSLHFLNRYLKYELNPNRHIFEENNISKSLIFNHYGLLSEYEKNSKLILSISYNEIGKMNLKDFSGSYFEQYIYNSNAFLTSLNKPLNSYGFVFNPNGNIKSLYLTQSDSIQYEYDYEANVSSIVYPLGNRIIFRRDKYGVLEELIGIQNSPIRFNISENNLLIAADNERVYYYFDDSFRVKSDSAHFINGLGVLIQNNHINDYFPNYLLLNSSGNQYFYENNLVSALTKSNDNTFLIAYNNNNLSEISKQNGENLKFLFDINGNISKVLHNNVDYLEFEFYEDWNLKNFIQGNRKFEFEYDSQNRLKIMKLDTLEYSFSYDLLNNIQSIHSNINMIHNFIFDQNSDMIYYNSGYYKSLKNNIYRQVASQEFSNNSIINNYDDLGRIIRFSTMDNYFNETVIDYLSKNYIENIYSLFKTGFYFNDYFYDQQENIVSSATQSDFQIKYNQQNDSLTISFQDVNVLKYSHLDSIILYYSNGIRELKLKDISENIVYFELAKNDSIIYSESYNYLTNQNLKSRVIGNNFFTYDYSDGNLSLISLNNNRVVEIFYDQFNNITRKEYLNDTVFYNYNNNLRIIQLDSIEYFYDDNNFLTSKAYNNSRIDYYYNNSGNLDKTVKNQTDTTHFFYNGKNMLIATMNQNDYFYSIRNEKLNTFYISSISKNKEKYIDFIFENSNIKHPIGMIKNDSIFYFHNTNEFQTFIITDELGNIVGENLFTFDFQIKNMHIKDLQIVGIENSLIFPEIELFYKEGVFYDISSKIEITPQNQNLPFINLPIDSIKTNIKLKFEDIADLTPKYFKYCNLNSQEIEKVLIENSFKQQFNNFQTFDVNLSFKEQSIFLPIVNNIDHNLFEAFNRTIFILTPKLPEELDEPLIRNLITNKSKIPTYEISDPKDPLDKIIKALKLLDVRYEHLIKHLEKIHSLYYSQYNIPFHENISNLLYPKIDPNIIDDYQIENNFEEIYILNFGEQTNWINEYYRFVNNNLRNSYATANEYYFSEDIAKPKNFGISVNNISVDQIYSSYFTEKNNIEEINYLNFKRVFDITNPIQFLDNKLFIPGRAAYVSPFLELPIYYDFNNNLPFNPLNKKNFDLLNLNIK